MTNHASRIFSKTNTHRLESTTPKCMKIVDTDKNIYIKQLLPLDLNEGNKKYPTLYKIEQTICSRNVLMASVPLYVAGYVVAKR